MALKSLVWKGEALKERMRKAQIKGVNATMGACVVEAKSNHPWQNQSGVLEGGIGIADYAMPDEQGVRGTWGVQDVNYALIHEVGGTIHHPGGTAYVIGKDGKAQFVSNSAAEADSLPRTKPHDIEIPARPFLRPAGDMKYPELPAKIRKAYEELGDAPEVAGG